MYIPIHSTEHLATLSARPQRPAPVSAVQNPSRPISLADRLGHCLLQFLFGRLDHNDNNIQKSHGGFLRKRQYNGNAAHDLNVTIGIIVGVLVGVFCICVLAFLYLYGESISLANKRRRSRGHRNSSGSSKSSRSSGSSLPPPPPPPGPPTGVPPPPPP